MSTPFSRTFSTELKKVLAFACINSNEHQHLQCSFSFFSYQYFLIMCDEIGFSRLSALPSFKSFIENAEKLDQGEQSTGICEHQ